MSKKKRARFVPGEIPDEKVLRAEVKAELAEYAKMSAEDFLQSAKAIADPEGARDDLHEAKGFATAMGFAQEIDRQRMAIIKPLADTGRRVKIGMEKGRNIRRGISPEERAARIQARIDRERERAPHVSFSPTGLSRLLAKEGYGSRSTMMDYFAKHKVIIPPVR